MFDEDILLKVLDLMQKAIEVLGNRIIELEKKVEILENK